MEWIAEVGAQYGLAFNWKKLECLPIQTTAKIKTPDGTDVKTKESMTYLGSMLTADGRIDSELGRRIGLAQSDFSILEKVWKHCKGGRNSEYSMRAFVQNCSMDCSQPH